MFMLNSIQNHWVKQKGSKDFPNRGDHVFYADTCKTSKTRLWKRMFRRLCGTNAVNWDTLPRSIIQNGKSRVSRLRLGGICIFWIREQLLKNYIFTAFQAYLLFRDCDCCANECKSITLNKHRRLHRVSRLSSFYCAFRFSSQFHGALGVSIGDDQYLR